MSCCFVLGSVGLGLVMSDYVGSYFCDGLCMVLSGLICLISVMLNSIELCCVALGCVELGLVLSGSIELCCLILGYFTNSLPFQC